MMGQILIQKGKKLSSRCGYAGHLKPGSCRHTALRRKSFPRAGGNPRLWTQCLGCAVLQRAGVQLLQVDVWSTQREVLPSSSRLFEARVFLPQGFATWDRLIQDGLSLSGINTSDCSKYAWTTFSDSLICLTGKLKKKNDKFSDFSPVSLTEIVYSRPQDSYFSKPY